MLGDWLFSILSRKSDISKALPYEESIREHAAKGKYFRNMSGSQPINKNTVIFL